MRKVSVIIPAYNDAVQLERTLNRLHEIRTKEYENLELIVALRPSDDGTDAVANNLADIVAPGGKVNEARNAGARVATGEVFIFLDADSMPNFGVIPRIAEIVDEGTVGTCAAYTSKTYARARVTIAIQNFARRTKLIRGMANLFFCHRSLFTKHGITYNEDRNLGEFHEHIWRARKTLGVRYIFLNFPHCYEFSVDRYERVGYAKTLKFWTRFWWHVVIRHRDPAKLEEEYWNA